MAEFDTSVRLKEMQSLEITTPKRFEDVAAEVWAVLGASARTVGDGGGGEFWADFSSALQTRYVVCNLIDMQEESEGVSHANHFLVRLRAGRKPGRMVDVLLALLGIGAAWLLTRVVVPEPAFADICGLVLCMLALLALAAACGKPFGKKETALLKNKIKESI